MLVLKLSLALGIGLREKSALGRSCLSVGVIVKVRVRDRIRGEKRFGVVLSQC